MQIGILITTHKKYAAPLMCLLPTVEHHPLRLVVSGGHEVRSESVLRDSRVINVDHDSYDYTGLIEAISDPELIADWTHLLCVQDTMELGRHTIELCNLADPEAEATAANGWMCNLVLYRTDYIQRQSEFIIAQRNCSKHDAIRNEGALWRMAERQREFASPGCLNLGMGYPYSEVPRLKEYYTALEVVKWKANYGQNMHALVDTP